MKPHPPVELTRGLQALDEERPFDAHEHFEALWHAERGDARRLAKALVQIAAGFEKARRGEPRGARKNLTKAALNLAALDRSSVTVLGVRCSQLRAAVESDLAGTEALAAFRGSAVYLTLEDTRATLYDLEP